MAYELYKEIKTKSEYFNTWDSENFKQLTDELETQIYNRYIVKCKVFQRDDFVCQNQLCKTPSSSLTLHHVRFRKNEGEDKERNCITLCKSCHMGYHKAKKELKFGYENKLPAHMKNQIFKLEKVERIDWKKIRSEMRVLRKTLKAHHGINISFKQLSILMKFLMLPYNEFDD